MLDVQVICKAYGFEVWIAPTVQYVYCSSTYGLSVLTMVSKYDLSQMNKLLYDSGDEE
jgi:hypothetical protein